MENINMTDINKTNEEIILECVKKIESDNVTIHNQKVSYFKNMLKSKIFAIITIGLFYFISFTAGERSFGNSKYEGLQVFLILVSIPCAIASMYYLGEGIGSVNYISKFRKSK